MKQVSIFLIKEYFKLFFIIFAALLSFFVGIDYMQQYAKLPDSANMHVLYLFFNAYQSITIFLPLAIIFSFITFLLKIIKSSELTAIYSFGYSKKDIFKPLFWATIGISAFYMLLNFSDAAYAKEKYIKILKGTFFSSFRDDLLLKYDNKYIYFGKLLPTQSLAKDVRVFEVVDSKLSKYILADEARFVNDSWVVYNAKIMTKPSAISIGGDGLMIEYKDEIKILKGFKPRIINSVYEDNSISFTMSVIDALNSWILLSKENINSDKVRLILYNTLIAPLFASFLIVMIFYFAPTSSRMMNSVLFGTVTIFGSLIIWGILFVLSNLSFGGVILPEVAVLAPICILFIISLYLYKKL